MTTQEKAIQLIERYIPVARYGVPKKIWLTRTKEYALEAANEIPNETCRQQVKEQIEKICHDEIN